MKVYKNGGTAMTGGLLSSAMKIRQQASVQPSYEETKKKSLFPLKANLIG